MWNDSLHTCIVYLIFAKVNKELFAMTLHAYADAKRLVHSGQRPAAQSYNFIFQPGYIQSADLLQ